jgi:hypothetical protein
MSEEKKTKSYFVYSESKKQNDNLQIDKFHLNIWFFSKKTAIFDIGVLVKYNEEPEENSVLGIYTPFAIKGDITNLKDKIENKDILNLIFNDILTITEISDLTGTSLFRIAASDIDQKKFILISNYEINKIDSNKIEIRFKLGRELKKKIIEQSLQLDDLCIYFRFRFHVDFKNTSNLQFANRFSNHCVTYDIRFNELRLFERAVCDTNMLLKIKTVYIFIIKSLQFRSGIYPVKYLSYIRFLEVNSYWQKYLDLRLKKSYVIYFWKDKREDISGGIQDNSFNLLISFEKDRKLYTLIGIGITLAFSIASLIISVLSLIYSLSINRK